ALLVFGIARIANAQFDGFGVSSSTFSNQYNGNQIWDGTNFVGDWAGAGGLVATDLSLNGTNLVMNQTTTNGWVQQDGGATAWEVGLGGSWTVEISMDLDIG